MGQVVHFLVATLLRLSFLRRRRWRRDPWSRWFPDQSSPFVCLAEQLQCCQRVAWITFDPQYLSDYLQLLSTLAQNLKADTATYIGQLARQVHECSFWSNILSYAFRDVVFTARIPFGLYLESGQISWAGSIVSICFVAHVRASFLECGDLSPL
jgi:hypothetical protein